MNPTYEYAVYDPMNEYAHKYVYKCETLEEARKYAQECIDYYNEDGYPEEYLDGGLQILKILKVSRFRVADRKEDHENKNEWPYGDDFDEVGDMEMVDLDSLAEEAT
jgi:hypothetical protein